MSASSELGLVRQDKHDGERLQKVLARAGVASRRQCETLISEGRVEVDRAVVDQLGSRVDLSRQEIRVDGEVVSSPHRAVYLVNKPQGVVSTANDPSGRPRVIDLVPASAGRLFNVGRLDMSSEGLILLTNDGELANQLTHPRYGVEKTYQVEVAGHPTPEVLATLRKGVRLAEAPARVVTAKIKSRRKNSSVLTIVLDEGRNREIRRLLAKVGHKVQRLTRVAVGPIKLGDLPVGAYRQLTRDEVRVLRRSLREAPEPQRSRSRSRRRPAAGSRR